MRFKEIVSNDQLDEEVYTENCPICGSYTMTRKLNMVFCDPQHNFNQYSAHFIVYYRQITIDELAYDGCSYLTKGILVVQYLYQNITRIDFPFPNEEEVILNFILEYGEGFEETIKNLMILS